MQSPTSKINDIERLLACYPPVSATDPAQVLRNYLLAVDDYHAFDVTEAVDAFIKGSAPGVNASFLPPAPALGAECRRQMNLRLDRENRDKRLRPALPSPTIHHSAEDRAKVKAMVDGLVQRTAEQIDAEKVGRKNGVIERANERFHPDMSDAAILRRLNVTPYYSAGDPEGAEDAA